MFLHTLPLVFVLAGVALYTVLAGAVEGGSRGGSCWRSGERARRSRIQTTPQATAR